MFEFLNGALTFSSNNNFIFNQIYLRVLRSGNEFSEKLEHNNLNLLFLKVEENPQTNLLVHPKKTGINTRLILSS